jgi:ABC-type transport system involved in multi-copper enzyme maturation permease subunit
MMELLKIEWLKLKSYRAFWIMVGLYLFILFSTIIGLPAVLDFLAEKINDNVYIKAFKIVAFNFADIWQNIAYVAGWRWSIKVFLALLVLIIISNEFTFLTIRSNIMHGLSRTQFMLGKLSVVFLLTLMSTVALFIAGLYLGLMFSATKTVGTIFGNIYFLGVYFLELFTYLTFALLIGLLIRKTGFAIITLLSYNFLEIILQYYVNDDYEKFLPLNAINGIVTGVNSSMLTVKTPEFDMSMILQEHLSLLSFGICIVYLALFLGAIYLYLNRRDL